MGQLCTCPARAATARERDGQPTSEVFAVILAAAGRRAVFREWAVREDGDTSSGVVPLGRTMDATAVLSEITLQLAASVAWLDE
jgi:hypothetical protein